MSPRDRAEVESQWVPGSALRSGGRGRVTAGARARSDGTGRARDGGWGAHGRENIYFGAGTEEERTGPRTPRQHRKLAGQETWSFNRRQIFEGPLQPPSVWRARLVIMSVLSVPGGGRRAQGAPARQPRQLRAADIAAAIVAMVAVSDCTLAERAALVAAATAAAFVKLTMCCCRLATSAACVAVSTAVCDPNTRATAAW